MLIPIADIDWNTVLGHFDWGNVVTGGGFAALVWFLVTKQIPKQNADFIAATKAESKLYRDSMDAERRRLDRMMNLVLTLAVTAMQSPAMSQSKELKKAMEDFKTQSEAETNTPVKPPSDLNLLAGKK